MLELVPAERLGSTTCPKGAPEDHVFVSELGKKRKYIPMKLELFKDIDDPQLSTQMLVEAYEKDKLKHHGDKPFPTKHFRMLESA